MNRTDIVGLTLNAFDLSGTDIIGLTLNGLDLIRPQRIRAPAFLFNQQIIDLLRSTSYHTLLLYYQKILRVLHHPE
jgi:hypothetical protein